MNLKEIKKVVSFVERLNYEQRMLAIPLLEEETKTAKRVSRYKFKHTRFTKKRLAKIVKLRKKSTSHSEISRAIDVPLSSIERGIKLAKKLRGNSFE